MIAGWRGGQIAAVAVGLVIGVLSIRSRPSVIGVILAIIGLGSGMALAFWPIQGRTGEQWLPLAARWLWTAFTGSRRQLAPGPRAGHRATVDRGHDNAGPAEIRAESVGWGGGRGPGRGSGRAAGRRATVFEGLTVVGVPFGAGSERAAGELGMTIDARARTATAVLVVRGHSFALLGTGDQDGRIAAWARVLSSLAREGSDVHRLQWIEACLPDDGSAVRRHVSDHAVVDADSAAARSYQTLVDEAAPVTRRHQVLMALSIRTARPLRAARSSGGGVDAIGAVLSREVHSLHQALEGADIVVDGALGPGALSRVIGEASAALADSALADNALAETGLADPCPQSDVPTRSGAGHALPGSDRLPDDDRPSQWPWPMAVEPSWDAVHTDGTWHATYWIAEWPRVDVTPDFLAPLLFSPLRRSLSLVMEPMSPSRAARQVAQARTADLADGELRRRGGFLVTARQTREKAGVEERDVELADGHAQFRFSGYVTVTTDTRAELSAARGAVEQAAGQAGIELRLLYGAQDVAFACSLPLGRGLS
jgi:hypothetical protein